MLYAGTHQITCKASALNPGPSLCLAQYSMALSTAPAQIQHNVAACTMPACRTWGQLHRLSHRGSMHDPKGKGWTCILSGLHLARYIRIPIVTACRLQCDRLPCLACSRQRCHLQHSKISMKVEQNNHPMALVSIMPTIGQQPWLD